MLAVLAAILGGLANGATIADVLGKAPGLRRAHARRRLGVTLYQIYRRSIDIEANGRKIVRAFERALAARGRDGQFIDCREVVRAQYVDLARLANEIAALDAQTRMFSAFDDEYVRTVRAIFGHKISLLGAILGTLDRGRIPTEAAVRAVLARDRRHRSVGGRLDARLEGLHSYGTHDLTFERDDTQTVQGVGKIDRRAARRYIEDAGQRLDEIRKLNVK